MVVGCSAGVRATEYKRELTTGLLALSPDDP